MSSTWRNKGFTLLEVLIALAILAILCGALYGTYFSLMRGREAAVTSINERRELSVTLDQLRRELSSAFYSGGNKRLHFIVEDRDYFGKPASTLDFTAIVPPRSGQQPLSDQVRLIYAGVGKEDKEGKENKEEKLLLTRQEKDLYYTLDSFPYAQMQELEGFLVECYDGSKWVRTWDTALNGGALPKCVRITITLREGEKTTDFSTIALLRLKS